MRGSTLLMLVVAVCVGCGSSDAPPVKSPTTAGGPPALPARPASPAVAPPAAPIPSDAATPPAAPAAGQPEIPAPRPPLTPLVDPPEIPAPVTPVGVEQEVAKVGVGAKGGGYGGGIISEPIRQRFLIEHRLVFEVQIPKAMQIYKASNERNPPSHKEFMVEIIRANSIRLPELPPGQTYFYDAKTAQLMVQRPAK